MRTEFKFRDVIHGYIKLDEQEIEIVNSPEYQRLRRIRQLSLTEMVYPGANHTRFEHSLGVLQLATEIFDNIIKQEHSREILGFKNEYDSRIYRLRKIIRLAALLHDIGHAPFSHTSEELMPFLSKNKKGRKYKHEDYSFAIIKTYFKEYIEEHKITKGLDITVNDVTALLGDKEEHPTINPIIWRSLLSGQLDADRGDYLLRDSYHLGVNYGLYDRDRFINYLTVYRAENNTPRLAILYKGINIAESFIIARYKMFSQVYFHHVRRILDYHVEQATKTALKDLGFSDGLLPSPDGDNLKRYVELDDWSIFGMFKNNKDKCKHTKIILNRKPYKLKGTWDDWDKNAFKDKEEAKVEKILQNQEGYLDKADTRWYKLGEDDLDIYNPNDGKIYKLSEKSKIVKTLSDIPKPTRLFLSED